MRSTHVFILFLLPATLWMLPSEHASAAAPITGCSSFNGSKTGGDAVLVFGDGFTASDSIRVSATVSSHMSTTAGNYTLTLTHGGSATSTAFVSSGSTVTLGPLKVSGSAGLTLDVEVRDAASAATPATVTLTYACSTGTSSSISTLQATAYSISGGASVTSVSTMLSAAAIAGLADAVVQGKKTASELVKAAVIPTSSGLGGPVRKGRQPQGPRRFNIWSDARITGADDDGRDDYHFTQLNTVTGLDYLLTPNVLIGAMLGFETMQADVGSADLDGHGISMGTYLGWRVRPNLTLTVAAYKTFADYDASADGVTAEFHGNRTSYLADLTGSHDVRGVTVEPSLSFAWVEEDQDRYQDSGGETHAAREHELGRFATGGRLTKVLSLTSALQWQPYAGVYADYYFTNDAAAPSSNPISALSEGWSARATAGANFAAGPDSPWRISLGAELGNIGSGNALVPSGHAGASLRF